MRSVAGPGRGVRAPRLSGASRASTEGARARAATSRESYRLVRLSAERQREPSRACHGEGHRQRGDIGAALDPFGVRGAARVHGPVRNWRGPTRRLTSEHGCVDKASPKRRGVGRESEGVVVPVKGRTTRSEEHTSELQSLAYLVCRLLLEKKKKRHNSVLDIVISRTHRGRSSS